MGRTPKNENHVLVRLRRAISTPADVITREKLAERIGVSASTIRDIEMGKFGLTEAMARRLMIATSVSIRSLIDAENPLKDVSGKDLGPTINPEILGRIDAFQEIAIFKMIEAALRAADKRKHGPMFYELFNEWLPDALESINAIDLMREVLDGNLGIFDPSFVPARLRPTQPKKKRRWEEAYQELVTMALEESEPLIQKGADETTAYFEAYQNILDSGRLRDRISKRAKAERSS